MQASRSRGHGAVRRGVGGRGRRSRRSEGVTDKGGYLCAVKGSVRLVIIY